ncbi:MAG: hypothetical protein WC069_06895 [Candidatus Shapirobacteria bacterium]
MQEITLNKKTGFRNLTPSKIVVINDFRGLPFYSTEEIGNPVKEFNLPEGKYYLVCGNIAKMVKPVKYRLAPLPIPQRNLKPPFDFNVIFSENPNKCSILWGKKVIVFDYSLKEKSLPELWFILFHEFSHARYSTEKYADLSASNLMKVKGFNPSQIGNAPITSLSSIQFERKNFIVDNLIKHGRH